ncbi:MAG: DUF1116 domain-containing protein [Desulfobacterales bacterium]|nr:DUF1116 domain-containing protein [Desulfobacterales bacterium]
MKKEMIEEANKKAVERMIGSRPFLVDVQPAAQAVMGMKEKMVCHAGPPTPFDDMLPSFKNAIYGGILWEKWAKTPQDAEKLIRNGEVTIEPNHHHNGIGTMYGITTPSMPVFVVEDKVHGTRTTANIREGTLKALRYGCYDESVARKLDWNRDVLGPMVGAALRDCGGIDMVPLMGKALHMGDDGHNENRAANLLICMQIIPHILKLDYEKAAIKEVVDWMNTDSRFVSTAEMAACKAITLAAHNIECCSIVTTMCRNGTYTGIRVSGLGDRWFTAPAPTVNLLFFPGYGPKDATKDCGDSCVTEVAGIGAMAMAAAPAMVQFVGGMVSDAINYTREMVEITAGRNPNWTIPYLDFQGCSTGIDIIKVVKTGMTPHINTSIGHVLPDFGQIGAGMTRAPLQCFADALGAFAEKVGL